MVEEQVVGKKLFNKVRKTGQLFKIISEGGRILIKSM